MREALLQLQHYNTQVVLLGVSLLGLSAGLTGVFLLLRERSLLADATSHATLPGIALAFLLQPLLGFPARFFPGLLLGAFATGLMGMWCIQWIPRQGRIHADAAMGIVLSVFYGFGIALLGIILRMQQGGGSGLKGFLVGRTASMLQSDAQLIGVAAAIISVVILLLFKEFKLLCFDEGFAGSQGWPVRWLDGLLMGAVVSVTVIGLQAVGLVLVVALLVIPAAASRFWTHRLSSLLLISGISGALCAWLGAAVSAIAHRLPAGPLIILTQGGWFAVSLLLGPRGGLLPEGMRHHRLRGQMLRQHLLRALLEIQEGRAPEAEAVSVNLEALLQMRSWSAPQVRRGLRRLSREGLVYAHPDGAWGLTRDGWPEARRLLRNHRLWELYLLHHAESAPGQVDRDADRIEHVLNPAVIAHLETLLQEAQSTPASPHPLHAGGGI